MRGWGPFSGKAQRPHLQPVVDMLIAYAREQGLSTAQLAIKVFGEVPDQPGVPRQPSTLYQLLHGRAGVTPLIAERVKAGLDLELPMIPTTPPGGAVGKPVKAGRARQALVAYEKAQEAPELPPLPRAQAPHRQGPPRFALVVQQDGTASMTMNLLDVDAGTALRAFDAMKAIGLVREG